MGNHSILAFKRGASILKSAVCVIPSYPAKKEITDIELTEKGELKPSLYPHGWDDYDWKVYQAMRRPNKSFGKAGGETGLCWGTVRDHFKKILKDCSVWASFYPLGFKTYQEAVITFKTKYEQNLKNELQKIDRTSFLYKFDDTIILILHYLSYTDLKIFVKFKKARKIKNLKFSAPVDFDDIF